MKHLALALLTALTVTPTSGLAATSGTIDASMTVTYGCDITFPATATLVPVGSTATATSNLTIQQNATSTYTISALTLTGPVVSGGSITIQDGIGNSFVTNSSTSTSASGQVVGSGIDSNARVLFSLSTYNPTFVSGAYSISATLTCSQYVP